LHPNRNANQCNSLFASVILQAMSAPKPRPPKPPKLYNTLDLDALRAKLEAEDFDRTTVSFYQYAHIEDPAAFRNELFAQWSALGVLGRTYVAKEGINAQISVPSPRWDEFVKALYAIDFLDGIRLNVAVESDDMAFLKLIVKVRDKILADGLSDDTFDVTNCGRHLRAEEFNKLTDREDSILIDMRNHYESEVGHFEGAICPNVENFRDEIDLVENLLLEMDGTKVDRPIIMYCTGGIRCEKASAWFKHRGFPNVHQLEGGIIEYVRQVKEDGLRNKYKGVNFVFDERLSERVSDDVLAHCHLCGTASDSHTNCVNPMCNVLMILCVGCAEKHEGACGEVCQTVAALPEEEQRELRKGKRPERRHFPKERRADASGSCDCS